MVTFLGAANRDQRDSAAEVNSQSTEHTGANQVAAEEPPVCPEEWLRRLAMAGIDTDSFVESAMQIVRLDVNDFRAKFVEVECQLLAIEQPDPDSLRNPLNALRHTMETWLPTLEQVSVHVSEAHSKDNKGDEPSGLRQLESALVNLASQVETTLNNLSSDSFSSGTDYGLSAAIREVRRLIRMAHSLRESSIEMLMNLAGEGNTVQEHLSDEFLSAHFAFASALSKQSMPGCAALLDIDRFDGINTQLGTRVADVLADEVGRVISNFEICRNGTSFTSRLGGGTYILVCPKQSVEEAGDIVEYIRQSLGATAFRLPQDNVKFTVSGAVASFEPGTVSSRVLASLAAVMKQAKEAGGDTSRLDNGKKIVPASVGNHSIREAAIAVAL